MHRNVSNLSHWKLYMKNVLQSLYDLLSHLIFFGMNKLIKVIFIKIYFLAYLNSFNCQRQMDDQANIGAVRKWIRQLLNQIMQRVFYNHELFFFNEFEQA